MTLPTWLLRSGTKERLILSKSLLVGLLTLIACVVNQPLQANPRPSQPRSPTLPDRREIAALIIQWNRSLSTLDPNQVARLYAENAILIPTLSAQICTSRQQIKEYFSRFLREKPVSHVHSQTIYLFNHSLAMAVGTYTFTVSPSRGKTVNIHARYTFVYQKQHQTWLIIHHHSSLIPRTR